MNHVHCCDEVATHAVKTLQKETIEEQIKGKGISESRHIASTAKRIQLVVQEKVTDKYVILPYPSFLPYTHLHGGRWGTMSARCTTLHESTRDT